MIFERIIIVIMTIGIGIDIKGISVFREGIPVFIYEIGIFVIEKVRILHLLNTIL
jgi:hypothetical protein